MTYLLLAGDFPPQVGGIQSYHSALARALTALGRKVIVLGLSQEGDAAYDAACPHAVCRVSGEGGKLATSRRLEAQGREIAGGLAEPLRGIIATKWSPESPAALHLARQLGVPWGVFGHDREFILTGLNPLKWAVQRYVLPRADFCFAISQFAAGNFRRRAVPPERIRMVGSGVEADTFAPDPQRAQALRQELGLGSAPVLVTVSRLVAKKGHLTVLEALPKVREQFPTVRYLVVGEGEDRPLIAAAVARLGLQDTVLLTGRAPAADLRGYYTLADLMVMPSYDIPGQPTEGFGLAYLEANSCGTPVIGTRCGGIPDAVDHGVTGLLVPPRQPAALAGAIRRLLGDPAGARWMGEQGQQRAREWFRWELVARRVEAAFDEVHGA